MFPLNQGCRHGVVRWCIAIFFPFAKPGRGGAITWCIQPLGCDFATLALNNCLILIIHIDFAIVSLFTGKLLISMFTLWPFHPSYRRTFAWHVSKIPSGDGKLYLSPVSIKLRSHACYVNTWLTTSVLSTWANCSKGNEKERVVFVFFPQWDYDFVLKVAYFCSDA